MKLALFLAGQRPWAVRHGLSLQEVVKWHLRRNWIELRGFEQIFPHDVYELRIILGRSSPSTKEGIGVAVRQAFLMAGRKVGRDFVYVDIRGHSVRATVYAECGRAVCGLH